MTRLLYGTTYIMSALEAAASPSAANPFATASGTQKITLGTAGAVDGEMVLSSVYRQNFSTVIFEANFSGNYDPILFSGYNPPNSSIYTSSEQSIYTGYEGYYWVGASEQYSEWYVEWKNQGATTTRRPFQTSIRLNTNFVNTFIYADNLVIGNGAGSTNYFQISSGAGNFSIPLQIIGPSDAAQLLVRAYSTQTNPIFQVQDDTSNNLYKIEDNGIVTASSITPANSQVYMYDHAITATAGQDNTYMYGYRIGVYRDNCGPTFSWTYGFDSTVWLRALSANSLSRYAHAASFTLAVQASAGRTANISVQANVIESRITKQGGGGTETINAPHGIDIGDMGGSGSYNPAAIYIAAQSAPTSGTNYAIDSRGGRVRLLGLPTSSAGLASGELWNNGGVINIA